AVHGAYQLTNYLGIDGKRHTLSIDAAPEICDGIDNNCDGTIDDVIRATGKVINARNGQPLANAAFEAWCDGTMVATDVTDGNGKYAFQISLGKCKNTLTIRPISNGFACADSDEDKVDIAVSDFTRCVEKQLPDIIATERPNPGTSPGIMNGLMATTFLTWGKQATGAPQDIDFHVIAIGAFASTNLGYLSPVADPGNSYGPNCQAPDSGYACGLGMIFDRDARNWDSPETISIRSINTTAKYLFYARNWSGVGDWGATSQKPLPQVRFYDWKCNELKQTLSFPPDYPAVKDKPYWNVWQLKVDGPGPNGGQFDYTWSIDKNTNALQKDEPHF
ncbi:MAG: hypothetical protein RLZZ324_66, partial [Candidatus Parcubacteria bacterium]